MKYGRAGPPGMDWEERNPGLRIGLDPGAPHEALLFPRMPPGMPPGLQIGMPPGLRPPAGPGMIPGMVPGPVPGAGGPPGLEAFQHAYRMRAGALLRAARRPVEPGHPLEPDGGSAAALRAEAERLRGENAELRKKLAGSDEG